ncbi:MAG: deoxyribonuclease IV [Gemmatimonadaceae bacterium]|nr:deoxyribonuclease IV [Gemmatimonadaceae bacterium]
MNRIFGAHVADEGGFAMAARRAGAGGFRALQLFTAKPTFYNERAGVSAAKAAAFTAAREAAGIEGRHVLVHAAYVLNTASPEPEKAERARLGLTKELERTSAIGALGCCFHPGSAGDDDPALACERVGDTIRRAVETVPGTARILVENTAGAGRTMGRSAEEIAAILARVPAELRHRTGYGLDTCHLFAAGHDIASAPEAQAAVLAHFERVIGEPPAFFHLNDSQHPFGSNKDRHALLGEGTIGAEPFRWLVRDPRAEGIPLILETPSERKEVADDDASPDAFDVRMRTLLEGFLEGE